MTQWEYLVVYISDSKVAEENKSVDVHLDADRYTERLNKYGNAGWELVSFVWETDGARAALKRVKAPKATEAESSASTVATSEAASVATANEDDTAPTT